eukprot:4734035-Pyramimonas_sp.AAC.1
MISTVCGRGSDEAALAVAGSAWPLLAGWAEAARPRAPRSGSEAAAAPAEGGGDPASGARPPWPEPAAAAEDAEEP